MVRTIDVHKHIRPVEWLDYLEKSDGRVRIERAGPTSRHFYVGEDRRLRSINKRDKVE